MLRKFLLSTAMILSLSLISSAPFAADECKADADCKDGNVCILAVTPHVCKPPQAAGAPCKRDGYALRTNATSQPVKKWGSANNLQDYQYSFVRPSLAA
jgi:hypothetical protein